MSRKLTRESIMNTLYQMEMHENFSLQPFEGYLADNVLEPKELEFAKEVTGAFVSNKEAVDEAVSAHLKGWTIERISKVDLSIVRLAITEILYIDSLTPAISINEAVNLAKKYSDDESAVFVNGLLGEFVRHLEAGK